MTATEAPTEPDLIVVTASVEARELLAARGLRAQVEQAARLALVHFPSVAVLELCVQHSPDDATANLVLNVVTGAPAREAAQHYTAFADAWVRAAPPAALDALTVTFCGA
jgi:hypothetical protein